MSLSPTEIKYLIMGILSAAWLASYRYVQRVDTNQMFHIATLRRDARRARFYFLSAWVGLAAAFLSFLCLEALASVAFETSAVREWVFGISRGIGLWGLLVVSAVWSQVGYRASLPNSDGRSLIPSPEERK